MSTFVYHYKNRFYVYICVSLYPTLLYRSWATKFIKSQIVETATTLIESLKQNKRSKS